MSATTAERAPTREDFAALLDESYGQNEAFEGTVVKGTVDLSQHVGHQVGDRAELRGAVHQCAGVREVGRGGAPEEPEAAGDLALPWILRSGLRHPGHSLSRSPG